LLPFLRLYNREVAFSKTHFMKKQFLLSFLACLFYCNVNYAQAPFNTTDSVNINNINANVMVHGDMWWNIPEQAYACFFPNGTHKNIQFAAALWMSGYDAGSHLHVAAQTYRQNGNDYWPGPLDTGDTLTYTTSSNWAKIWKVNRTDIQYFQSLPTHTTTNTPQAILTWPGNGNANAQGNGGASLTITSDMAPFIDLNGNGIYEPLSGEYPDIKGDQALWWVFSDNGPTHNQTNGKPLGVEVHAMSYAYKRGTLIDDVVYYDYTIVNKSAKNYSNFRAALFDDVDLGWYADNYLGFDSTWRMGIGYNGTNCSGCSAGNPVNSYGLNPPQVAVTMVVLPGDAGTSYVPVGSFTYFNNNGSIIGNPAVDTEYNNYMRSKLRNGQHFTDDFSGRGIPSVGYGSGPDCNYVFPGNPSDTNQWSECVCNDDPDDVRFVLSSNDFTLNAGSTAHMVLALIVADSAGGCGATSFDSIRVVADTAWNIYYNPPPLIPSAVANIANDNSVTIYPNPANDKLYITNSRNNTAAATIIIYNVLGQAISISINQNGNGYEADISKLPPGLYNVLYRQGDMQMTVKFIKE